MLYRTMAAMEVVVVLLARPLVVPDKVFPQAIQNVVLMIMRVIIKTINVFKHLLDNLHVTLIIGICLVKIAETL